MSFPKRRLLTDFLIDQLTTTGQPVGDDEAPKNAGWTGDPNAPTSEFVPYTVLVPLTASRSIGQFAEAQDTWVMPYRLIAAGTSRTQCDWMGDLAMETLDVALPTRLLIDLDGVRWKVMQFGVVTLDGAVRLDAAEPPYFQRGDSFMVQLTKELA